MSSKPHRPWTPKRICWLDLETGGFEVGRPITQIGAIVTDPDLGRELATWHRRVVFDPTTATDEALAIQGYDPELWAREAVELDAALFTFATWVDRVAGDEPIPGGHNICRFDLPHLAAACEQVGVVIRFDYHAIDTCMMASALLNAGVLQRTSLDLVCQALAVERGRRHHALDDARASLNVARIFQRSLLRGLATEPRPCQPTPSSPPLPI